MPPGTCFLKYVADPDVVYYYPEDATEPWRFLWVSFAGEGAKSTTLELVERHGPIFALPENHAVVSRLLAFRDADGGIDVAVHQYEVQ